MSSGHLVILVAVIGVKELVASTSAGSPKRWVIVTRSPLISRGAHSNLDRPRYTGLSQSHRSVHGDERFQDMLPAPDI